ncbi:hypothetical protein Ddc_11712 [Ditylenchus destructor]|nr:hypothetical protein Ddc_11712 [Ditylenchus destructor]
MNPLKYFQLFLLVTIISLQHSGMIAEAKLQRSYVHCGPTIGCVEDDDHCPPGKHCHFSGGLQFAMCVPLDPPCLD